MTQLAFVIDSKAKARIFSDTCSGTLEGKRRYQYKVFHIDDQGFAVTGRGYLKVIERASEKIKEQGLSFDDLLVEAPDILKESFSHFIIEAMNLEISGQSPEPDAILKYCRENFTHGATGGGGNFEAELCAVGYSQKHGGMGILLVASYQDFHVQEDYRIGCPFFMQTPAVEQYFKSPPKTDSDMVKGMRISYEAENRMLRDQGAEIFKLPADTKVKRTTVYADGRIAVKTIGPFLKKK